MSKRNYTLDDFKEPFELLAALFNAAMQECTAVQEAGANFGNALEKLGHTARRLGELYGSDIDWKVLYGETNKAVFFKATGSSADEIYTNLDKIEDMLRATVKASQAKDIEIYEANKSQNHFRTLLSNQLLDVQREVLVIRQHVNTGFTSLKCEMK